MIENLTGTHEIVNYRTNYKMRLYNNDEAENYPPHWHAPYEVILPVSGPYRAVCANREFNLREGDVLIICPGILHELFAPEEGERIIFQPSISCISLRELDMITAMLTPAVCITPEKYPDVCLKIRREILEIRDAYKSTLPYAETLIYSRFLDILCTVAGTISDDLSRSLGTEIVKQHEYVEKFRSVCDYINDHFAEDLSLESVAAELCISPSYLSKMLNEKTEHGFYGWLHSYRIRNAKELLATTDMKHYEIAERVGYNSYKKFAEHFLQEVHVSAKEYRRQMGGPGRESAEEPET